MPSTAASVLRAAGLWSLESPVRRFDAEDWWYRLRFDRPADSGPDVVLGLEGLASEAEVWLNGRLILSSSNMFVAHEVAVGAMLAATNELAICCRSLDHALKRKRPRPRWRTPMVENQQLRWHRTTLLGRTPGWSPPAAAVGPWRPIWLESRTALRVTATRLLASVQDGRGDLRLDCELRGPVAAGATVELQVTRNGSTWRSDASVANAGACRIDVQVPEPDLWWPHTHGEPALYDAAVLLRAPDGHVTRVDVGRIGFRTLALDRGPAGLAISVNGLRVFCRGAVWTPLDCVSLNASPGQQQAALRQLSAAGMNMLRVAGTMVYEDDAFYAACDALGLLVWQDFMFANMDYPGDDADFAASVATEAQQLLARLHDHPCIAVLCGNSEVEQQAAMWGADRKLWSPALFHERLAEQVRELCPHVPYWPSSAHGGAFPHQASAGSSSYFGVGAYLRPVADARASGVRFASECLAFANVPEPATLAGMPGSAAIRVHHPAWKSRSPRDLGAGWDFDDVRDHYLRAHFGVDPLSQRYADHERYLALSRRVSGEVMAQAFGEWRRRDSVCNGALVLFARDLWAGAGWGLIGADGLPKAAYHYLRHALQPRSLYISGEGMDGISVHIANEAAQPLHAVLELVLYRDSEFEVARAQQAISIDPQDCAEVVGGSLFERFHDLSYSHRFGPEFHDLIVATLTPADGSSVMQSCFFPGRPPVATPGSIGLVAEAHATGDGAYQLQIDTRAFAHSVHVEADGYECDDQYFHIAPSASRQLTLRPVVPGVRGLSGTAHALNARHAVPISVRR